MIHVYCSKCGAAHERPDNEDGLLFDCVCGQPCQIDKPSKPSRFVLIFGGIILAIIITSQILCFVVPIYVRHVLRDIQPPVIPRDLRP